MTTRRAFLLAAISASLVACAAKKPANRDVEPAPIVVAVAPAPVVDAGSSAIPSDVASHPIAHEMTALEESIVEVMNGWSKKTHCADFDYFPEGGYQNFWCHRPEVLNGRFLEDHAHAHIFLSGPHGGGFTPSAKNDFGHYDPAFVKWLADDVAPKSRDSAQRVATQAMFDQSMRPLATIFYWTRAKTIADQACFTQVKDEYAKLVAKKSLPEGYQEQWFFFMNPHFCPRTMHGQTSDQFYYDNGFDAGFDGNVAKTAVGFWVRRSLDGTLDEFSRALDKLVAAYMPELTPAPKHFPDSTAINATFTSLEKSATACKDARSNTASVSAKIEIAPAGTMTAKIDPRHGSPAELSCIDQKIRALIIPPFDGHPLHFDKTLRLR